MHMEERKGVQKQVIQKALVDLTKPPFLKFSKLRKSWEMEDEYHFPGPMQFFGDPEITDSIPFVIEKTV